jgi:hypothetical protein
MILKRVCPIALFGNFSWEFWGDFVGAHIDFALRCFNFKQKSDGNFPKGGG